MDNIEQKVKLTISQQLACDPKMIENQHFFIKDLGADSLDSVSLFIALEEELGVEISDEAAFKIKTVQDAIDFFRSSLNKNS